MAGWSVCVCVCKVECVRVEGVCGLVDMDEGSSYTRYIDDRVCVHA